MRKFLRRFFILLRVAIVVTMLTNGAAAYYVHTCESLAMPPLQALVQMKISNDFNWRAWIDENYGYLTWNIRIYTGNEVRNSAHWESALYSHSVYHDLESGQTIVYRRARYFSPTFGDIIRCFGEPSHYQAYDNFDGLATDYSLGLWYPNQGLYYGILLAYYHQHGIWITPDGQYAYTLKNSTLLPDSTFMTPGTIIDVATSSILIETWSGYPINVERFLSHIKPWLGRDNVTFERGYFEGLNEFDEDEKGLN